jgi:hypothetical protein
MSEKTEKLYQYRPEGYVVISDKKETVPLFCPVCEFAMISSDDRNSYASYQCCYDCELRWAQSMRKSWLDGWRPELCEIEKERKRKRKIPPSFHF